MCISIAQYNIAVVPVYETYKYNPIHDESKGGANNKTYSILIAKANCQIYTNWTDAVPEISTIRLNASKVYPLGQN